MTRLVPDWEGVAGGTLLAPSGPKNHLYILLIKLPDDAGYNPNSYIWVNITSIKKDDTTYDDTCVLRAGDHPFIKHDSYVRYKGAEIKTEKSLQEQIISGIIVPKEDISDALLERIIQGLSNSLHTRGFIKKLL